MNLAAALRRNNRAISKPHGAVKQRARDFLPQLREAGGQSHFALLLLWLFRVYCEGVFTTETWLENLTTLREIEGQSSQRGWLR